MINTSSKGMISAICGYLVNQLPGLKHIRAVEKGDEVSMDFIFNTVN